MRLLILACSERKVPDEALLPAYLRYDGPAYRTLRRWLREAGAQLGVDLDLAILSARYGLIAWDRPIPDYNERMDRQRAEAHRAQVAQELERHLARRPSALLVCAGAVYWQALPERELRGAGRTRGGIGVQVGQLRRWLWEGVTPAAPGDTLARECEAVGAPASLS